MNQNQKLLFDASTYMLFESSGDSDQTAGGGVGDGCDNSDLVYSDALTTVEKREEEEEEDDDDAQSSCSYGSLPVQLTDDDNFEVNCEAMVEEDAEFNTEEEEDGVVDQCRGRGKEIKINKFSNKVREELMNEGERDKLFWEACLAS